MFDSNPHTPLIGIKGANLNLIQINFDNSENSTRESNHSQENLKSFEDTIEIKDDQKNAKKQGRKKFSSSRNKNNWTPKIVQITEKYLGKGKKASQCTRDQVEQLNLIVLDLEDLIK